MFTNNTFVILGIVIIINILLFFIFYYKNRKKKICYSVIDNPHPDILVNDIINAFYYSQMHGKNIKICLFADQSFIKIDQQNIKIRSIFNTALVKFLMHSTYNFFIFFITTEGILEILYFDNNPFTYNDSENILLIIDYSPMNNLFNIQQGAIELKNNNTQKTIHIIKEILKNNFR